MIQYSSKSFIDFVPGNITNLNNNSNINNNLIIQLNEEKNKNKKLLEELNNEKNKVKELNNKLKLYEQSSINYLQKIKELEQLIKDKDIELQNLRNNLNKNNNPIITWDKPIAVFFTSTKQDIHRPISCQNNDIFVRIEEIIYNEYPNYKDYNTYLTANGNIIKRFKTFAENKIKDGDTIIVNIYE